MTKPEGTGVLAGLIPINLVPPLEPIDAIANPGERSEQVLALIAEL